MDSQFGSSSEAPSRFNKFSSNKYVQGTKEFLDSNSLVAKFAFLLLVLLLFVIFLRLGSSLLSWILSPSPNPTLINGMVDAKQMLLFPQDPSVNGAVPILRSVNRRDGMEFTWSTWIFIDDFTYKQNEYKHIFHKGNDAVNLTTPPIGLSGPNNAPGLYITPHVNNLEIIMSTFDNPNNSIIIEDIPINKWVNVIIRLDGNKLDVYINGSVVRRHVFDTSTGGDVPFQNYGDVYALMNGGFSGYMSELRYFGYALPVNTIQTIVNAGPNLKMDSNSAIEKAKPHYLSSRWYFAGNTDEYNP